MKVMSVIKKTVPLSEAATTTRPNKNANQDSISRTAKEFKHTLISI